MQVLISIHDANPYFQKELTLLKKQLESVKKTYFVTPLWGEENALTNDFVQMLSGEELGLHGLTHFTRENDVAGKMLLMSSRSCKEFFKLNKADTFEKINRGKKIFEDKFHRSPAGFIPPMWYHNDHSIEILKEEGFSYTESSTAFINLQNISSTFSIPACFDFGNNKLLNFASGYGWKYLFKHIEQPLLRISIHPADIKNGFLKDILEIIKWLQDKNYIFLNYNELIKN